MASSSTPGKLRILALHGYTSNAFILNRRFGAIRKACRNVAEFEFINGPLLVQPITSTQSLDAPDREGNEEITEENTPLEEQPRAWWRASDDGQYKDIEQTWKLLSQEIKKGGRVDGVVGFSQGACLAFLLAAAFENPSLLPELGIPSDHPPLKFCIAISGFRPRDPAHQALFQDSKGGISTPTLSILGKADQIVDLERSQTLIDAAKNHREEYHNGGHVVPSQAPWRNFLRDFIASFNDGQDNNKWREVDGPAARVGQGDEEGSSAQNSGTSTPVQSSTERKSGL
ncbi:unnamed protein product [Sympodiomycopsis kandeliae]